MQRINILRRRYYRCCPSSLGCRAAVAFSTAAAVSFSMILERFVLAYSCDPCESRFLGIPRQLLAAVVVGRHATLLVFETNVHSALTGGIVYMKDCAAEGGLHVRFVATAAVLQLTACTS